LVALVREGRSAAFEAAYNRHHRSILSFCRHMLGDADEAEDAVQHTFAAAYTDLTSSDKAIHLRPWLFAIARNRCYSVLRARREQPVAELDGLVSEGLAAQVQTREDLRELVRDMRQLPEEQRAALVLSELDALSHAEISEALGVPREKVKALVFQARESLLASKNARETACNDIRAQIAAGRGATLRRANLRRHLRQCDACREFRAQVDRQRRQFALLLPVAPTIALKETVLGGAVGGGMLGGGLLAPSALKSAVAKGVMGALLAGAGTAGTVVVAASDPHGGGLRLHDARRLAEAQVPRTHRMTRGHQAVRHAKSVVLFADAESARQLADRTASWHVGGARHSATAGAHRVRASGADAHHAGSRARGERSGRHSSHVVAGPTGVPTGTQVAGTGSNARAHGGGPPSGVIPSTARISTPAPTGGSAGSKSGGQGGQGGNGSGGDSQGGGGSGSTNGPTGLGSGTGGSTAGSSVSTGTDGTNGGVDGGATSGGGRSTG
jgi:RNA polymerase sigma factor (sigma-70 family)